LGRIDGNLSLEALGEFVSEVDVETLIAATGQIWEGVRRERGIDACVQRRQLIGVGGRDSSSAAAAAESRYRVMDFSSTKTSRLYGL
jgi:hypothetical protein